MACWTAKLLGVGRASTATSGQRWRLVDLVQWIRDEFAVSISTQTMSRELGAMGYRKLTARPRHHAQDADVIPTLTNLPAQVAAIRAALPAAHP